MAAGKCKAAYHTDEWHGYGCSIMERIKYKPKKKVTEERW